MRISDWSSDVCSSDLLTQIAGCGRDTGFLHPFLGCILQAHGPDAFRLGSYPDQSRIYDGLRKIGVLGKETIARMNCFRPASLRGGEDFIASKIAFYGRRRRSEEHTSELQSLMRISYAVFCLKKKKKKHRRKYKR